MRISRSCILRAEALYSRENLMCNAPGEMAKKSNRTKQTAAPPDSQSPSTPTKLAKRKSEPNNSTRKSLPQEENPQKDTEKRKRKSPASTETNGSPRKSPKSPAAVPKESKGKARSMSEPSKLPSSILQSEHGDSIVPVQPKLLKRFYEPLVLLSILGRNRGEHLNEEGFEVLEDPTVLDNYKLRRSFVRNLAYLCDHQKGGDPTTAIALQQLPQNIVYWFASNRTPLNDTAEIFLRGTLKTLVGLKGTDVQHVKEDIFLNAVNFSSKRIMYYIGCLRPEVDLVLKYLLTLNLREDNEFIKWLQQVKEATKSKVEACRFCYETASSLHYKNLQHRSRLGAPCANKFDNIRHIIGRLNHTLKAVETVVTAAIKLPQLFDDFKVKRVKSQPSSASPLQDRNPSLDQIAGRMTSDIREIAELRTSLQYMDQRYGLSQRLKDQCMSSTWKPRVHAELVVLDLFWTQNLDFVAGDRFIGCSKSACYCCYHYIVNHPGRFVHPACHNNSWLNWKPPEIFDATEVRHIKTREDILNKMAATIRNEVIQQVKERRAPAKKQPDSNTEISTVRLGAREPSVDQTNGSFSSDYSAESSDEDGRGDESAMSDVCEGDIGSTSEIYAEVHEEQVQEGINTQDLRQDCSKDERDDSEDDDEGGGVPLYLVHSI